MQHVEKNIYLRYGKMMKNRNISPEVYTKRNSQEVPQWEEDDLRKQRNKGKKEEQ